MTAPTMRRKGDLMAAAWRLGLVLLLLLPSFSAQAVIGWVRVVDGQTCRPLEGAVVTVAGRAARTGADGMLALSEPAETVLVRAVGHGRLMVSDAGAAARSVDVRLPAVTPRALYLSHYGIGDAGLRGAALRLLDQSDLDALVIDVKGDRGWVPYRSEVALAAQVGAQKVITVHDMTGLLASLKARGIYTIARVVAFKDDPLARARPDLALRNGDGAIWADREGLAWTDPYRSEVRAYLFSLAEEAARLGFDEIQFDYVRFPDGPGPVYSKPNTEANRVAAITGFLSEAARRLAPYNVFVAADLFGYVLWNKNDTEIGQRLEDLAPHLDYISPMLYPSGFKYGIPGYRNPLDHPAAMVDLSLRNAQKRTGLPALRFRPWLQAFRDYAFDGRVFGADAIGAQIRAAEAFGSNGWMLWNPRNVYSDAGLGKPK